ncbi:uncharacterized protein LOC128921814 [Zeugodacus cucurbitae]|uniref:uncharacterized protein LOC128921814 n=1 Tax=Zeugodacus cucurbitae TaxID=28588 RepID=UPI0023D9394B|nr:uncharacterized protein LOC128921814 [Zeugodacus cucurbitae]
MRIWLWLSLAVAVAVMERRAPLMLPSYRAAVGVAECAQRKCSGYTNASTKRNVRKLCRCVRAADEAKFGSSLALGLKNHLKNKDGSSRVNVNLASAATFSTKSFR